MGVSVESIETVSELSLFFNGCDFKDTSQLFDLFINVEIKFFLINIFIAKSFFFLVLHFLGFKFENNSFYGLIILDTFSDLSALSALSDRSALAYLKLF